MWGLGGALTEEAGLEVGRRRVMELEGGLVSALAKIGLDILFARHLLIPSSPPLCWAPV